MSTYGAGTLYGNTAQYTITPPGPILPTGYFPQDGYCPKYLRFQFSGVDLGLYIFDINPSNYDPYPKRTTKSYQTILSSDPTIDETYIKINETMTWDRIPYTMWQRLSEFSNKKVDGTSDIIYFWDGEIGKYREAPIKVEGLKGDIMAGYDPIEVFSVSIELRDIP